MTTVTITETTNAVTVSKSAVTVTPAQEVVSVTIAEGGGSFTISDLMTTDLLAFDITIPAGRSMVYPNLQIADGVTVTVAGSLIVL